MREIFFFCISIIIGFVISSVLYSISLLRVRSKVDIEHTSVYECGFSPFAQARSPFNIKFYLVSLIFIIFDIETLILCPFAIEHLTFTVNEEFVLWVFCCFRFLTNGTERGNRSTI